MFWGVGGSVDWDVFPNVESTPIQSRHEFSDAFDLKKLAFNSRILTPSILITKYRTNNRFVIGVPTVKRANASYLETMLESLFERIHEENVSVQNKVLVIAMIAEVKFLNSFLIIEKKSFVLLKNSFRFFSENLFFWKLNVSKLSEPIIHTLNKFMK